MALWLTAAAAAAAAEEEEEEEEDAFERIQTSRLTSAPSIRSLCIYMAKETYGQGKRDLWTRQKRPMCTV
jgi:hypothetical protein